MPTTCVITGYKLSAGAVMLYGFILSGTVYEPPNGNYYGSPINVTQPVDETNDYSQCGYVNKEKQNKTMSELLLAMMSGRVLGGKDANEGSWPWMVYLYHKVVGKRDGFFCGGSLINRRWIVTAAHCISQPNSPDVYGVTLGQHDTSVISPHERDFDVERIIRHQDFVETTFNNDIALIKLSSTVEYSEYIRPVCIAPKGFPTDSTLNQEFQGETFTMAGRTCTVLGWGETERGIKSQLMQVLGVVILPHILCTDVTSNPSEAYHSRPVYDDDPKFCAGGSLGEDTCAGDSGGPLLCIYRGAYYLNGITSYGTTPCGKFKKPGVYTRIADFHDWILENATE